MTVHLQVDAFVLRKPEPKDVPLLYRFRNDSDVTQHLGGFSTGYAMQDLMGWVETHRATPNEVLWAVAQAESDACVGHVGLYNIDHRVRSAEFAVLIGAKECWGQGLGTKLTRAVVGYGFRQLNLHRVHLTVLETNARAVHVYEKLGFRTEGRLRDTQFRDGNYVSSIVMSVLEDEWIP